MRPITPIALLVCVKSNCVLFWRGPQAAGSVMRGLPSEVPNACFVCVNSLRLPTEKTGGGKFGCGVTFDKMTVFFYHQQTLKGWREVAYI